MKTEQNKRYIDILNRIEPKVREIYTMSHRKDVVMLYSVEEDKVFSYKYSDFKKMLHPNSQRILKQEIKDAQAQRKIVLYLRDEEKQVLKSYVI